MSIMEQNAKRETNTSELQLNEGKYVGEVANG